MFRRGAYPGLVSIPRCEDRGLRLVQVHTAIGIVPIIRHPFACIFEYPDGLA